MGQDRTTTASEQTVKQTPEMKELNKLDLDKARATHQQQIQAQQQGLNLINALLTGQALPGYLNQLPGGISEDVISGISQRAINDIRPSFQSSGILDSGVAAEISGRTSADIRNQAAQFNLGNLQSLLAMATGGSAQIQQPLLQQSGQLGGRLAGLSSMSTTGSTIGMNPFLRSFQTSLGKDLGSSLGKSAGSGISGAVGGFFG